MSLTCPSQAEILQYALQRVTSPGGALAGHVGQCAACRDIVAELRRVTHGIEASAANAVAGAGLCLDELALAEFAEGSGDAVFLKQAGVHIADCGHCRGQLAALVDLLGDPGVSAELRRLQQHRMRWTSGASGLAGAGLIAAAAVTLVLLLRKQPDQETAFHRAPTITATAAPVLLSPVGDVPDASILTWGAVAGADRYRVTLFDAAGQVRYQIQVADTTVALPDSIALGAARSYLWKVEARTELERWAASDLMEFRVTRGRLR